MKIDNLGNIKKILGFLSEAADKEMPEWSDAKPATEKGTFGKISDTGSHEMANADANFATVKDKAVPKLNTKPAFASVKDPGSNGGATGVVGKGKAKEVKLKENHIPNQSNNSIDLDLELFKDLLVSSEIPDELITPIIEIAKSADANSTMMDESTRNQRMVKTGSPALKEDEMMDNSAITENNNIMESKLNKENKERAQRLRKTIETLTGKKVIYKA